MPFSGRNTLPLFSRFVEPLEQLIDLEFLCGKPCRNDRLYGKHFYEDFRTCLGCYAFLLPEPVIRGELRPLRIPTNSPIMMHESEFLFRCYSDPGPSGEPMVEPTGV